MSEKIILRAHIKILRSRKKTVTLQGTLSLRARNDYAQRFSICIISKSIETHIRFINNGTFKEVSLIKINRQDGMYQMNSTIKFTEGSDK